MTVADDECRFRRFLAFARFNQKGADWSELESCLSAAAESGRRFNISASMCRRSFRPISRDSLLNLQLLSGTARTGTLRGNSRLTFGRDY